jgi:hypothetical protein
MMRKWMMLMLLNGSHNSDIIGRMMIAMLSVYKLTSPMVMNILVIHSDWSLLLLLINVI